MAGAEKDFLFYYHAYKDKIFTFFFYRVNFNRALAEDLTSEVFLKAFSHFSHFEPNRSFQAWIYRIAHNHLCNHYRSASREVDLAQAGNMDHDIRRQCETNLELVRIIKVMYGLEPYFRDVLIFRFVDGLSNSEIASLLDKEEGAVRTQISRALAVLKEALEGEG
ncbi:MAG: RNA polymerase sigma factor [Planctomycetes bacterium]|jgi:RNA polymerase sigma-70 factor (ECF subfamily)|nr:RNA polymerase sigma factor [Planctomycetota bacterium]